MRLQWTTFDNSQFDGNWSSKTGFSKGSITNEYVNHSTKNIVIFSSMI